MYMVVTLRDIILLTIYLILIIKIRIQLSQDPSVGIFVITKTVYTYFNSIFIWLISIV